MEDSKSKIMKVVKSLPQPDRERLKCAHQHCVASYVKLPNDRFVGVFVNGARHLIIEESYNDWSIGKIIYPS
jgi:hypothetical protein